MPDAMFHFDQPWWLLAILIIVPVSAWKRRSRVHGYKAQINQYADAHLMPYISGSRELKVSERKSILTRWSLLWVLLCVAMASPRWDFTEARLYTPGASLVILLDISRSMKVSDARPDRLSQARREIEDLVDNNPGVRLGLIAFASVAHVISPITDDGENIKKILPALTHDLVRLQGSRLSYAIQRAELLLASEPDQSGTNILLISDGDFVEAGLEQQIRQLATQGILFHALGIGTVEGGSVPAENGTWLRDAEKNLVNSRLNEKQLLKLTKAGQGRYIRAVFLDDDVKEILAEVLKSGKDKLEQTSTTLIWQEQFYWFALPALLLMLGYFRRILVVGRKKDASLFGNRPSQ